MSTFQALLDQINGIANALDEARKSEVVHCTAKISEIIYATQKRNDELATAQAEALVNAGIMMSELHAVHEKLNQARLAAEKSDRAKSEFLAHMSHEIRTPFNGVLGMTQLLLKSNLDEPQRQCALTIAQSAESLLTIINDILDFSKIEAGKLALQCYEFDLHEVIESVCQLFAVRARQKGLDLQCSIPEDLPSQWRGDAGRLRQVLVNLVGNAIKFTDRGEVELGVSTIPGLAKSTLRFEIADTGIGIEQAAQFRIFSPFAQADDGIERQFGGTGLGLAICAKIVEMMGSKMNLHSEPGRGARFWFDIALEVCAEQPIALPISIDLNERRVLLVSDNEKLLSLCTAHLHTLRLRIERASSDAMALGMLRGACDDNDPFRLIVLDTQVPETGELALTRILDSDSTLACVPRLFLCHMDDDGQYSARRETDLDSIVTKPLRRRDFRAKVIDILAGKHSSPSDTATLMPSPMCEGLVLVAEDNPVNQLVAKAMLKSLGLQCEIVADGDAAVQAWRSGRYDIILMDCQMPRMNGFEATRKIRHGEAQTSQARIPIIALTANAIVGDRETCIEAGMDDFLSKPYTESSLRAVLAHWLIVLRRVTPPAESSA